MKFWHFINKHGGDNHKRRIIGVLLLLSLHAIVCAAMPLTSILVLYWLVTLESHIWAFWLAMLSLLFPLCRYWAMSPQINMTYGYAFSLGESIRRNLLRILTTLPLGKVTGMSKGKLSALFNDDVRWIENFIGGGAAMIFGALAVPGLVLIAALTIELDASKWLIASIALGLPLFFLYSRIMQKSVAARSTNISALTTRISEHFSGMQELRAFNSVGEQSQAFRHDLHQLIKSYSKAALWLTPLSVVGLLIMESGLVVASYMSLSTTDIEHSDAVLICLVLLAAVSAYNPILMLFAGSGLFRLADTSRQNIDDFYAEAEPWLVDRQTKSNEPQNHIHDSKARYDIVFDKVCFQYPGSDAGVSNINFTAKNGQLTAIVGPSGAGKSTLFHLLSRFWQVQSGSIQIGDIDIYDIPESIVSKTISQVSQDVVLINDSLRNNVTLGIQGYSDEAVIKALTLANMTSLLRRLPEGLESKLGEGGTQLSGGEKQRITIARALLRDSPIVMLDEAMSSIDPTNAREIQQSIMELSRGKTLIVIAHRLSSIIGADNIIVMDKGEIQALGTHEQLLNTSSLYQILWKEHCSAKSWTIVE